MGLFSKKKKKERNKEFPVDEALAEIEELRRDISQNDSQKTAEKFFKVMRKHISRLFKIRYQFTYEELSEDITRKKIAPELKEMVTQMCRDLIEVEYAKGSISKDELASLAEKLVAIISFSERPKEKKKVVGFLGKLMHKKEIPLEKQLQMLPSFDAEPQPVAKEELPLFETAPPEIPPPENEITQPEPVPAAIEEPEIRESEPEDTDLPEIPVVQPQKSRGRKRKKEIEQPVQEDKALEENILPPPPVIEETSPVAEEIPAELPPPEVISKPEEKKGVFGRIMGVIKKEKKAVPEVPAPPAAPAEPAEPPAPEIKEETDKQKELLPSFTVSDVKPDKLAVKRDRIRDNISNIIEKIDTDRKTISDEFEQLKEKEEELTTERNELGKIGDSLSSIDKEKYSENMARLNSEIASKQSSINELEATLKEKEADLETRAMDLKRMQEEVTKMYVQVNEDKKELLKQEQDLISKEGIISEIKEELDGKNKEAISEIKRFKQDLEEKQKHFSALQDFYRKREEKLSLEESNLFEDKRRHIRYIESNIEKHKAIIEKDLILTESQIMEKQERLKKVLHMLSLIPEEKITASEKEQLETELADKERYFKKMESSFRTKGPEISRLQTIVGKKETKIIEMEKKQELMKAEVAALEASLQRREDQLGMKELDIRALEKKAENIKLKVKQAEMDVNSRHHDLAKRARDFSRLKSEIEGGLDNREAEINRIETTLKRRLAKLKRKELESEKLMEGIDYEQERLTAGETEVPSSEMLQYETGMSYEENEPGTPQLLEILRLLNIAKITLKRGKADEARDIYLSITNLYEKLPENEKEEAFRSITRIYKPKDSALVGEKSVIMYDRPRYDKWVSSAEPAADDRARVELLMDELERAISSRFLSKSSEVYRELQREYALLPDDQKQAFYPRIMELYNRVPQD